MGIQLVKLVFVYSVALLVLLVCSFATAAPEVGGGPGTYNVQELVTQAETELAAARAEHRNLMMKMADIGEEERGVDAKWALELYANVSRQAELKQVLTSRLALRDALAME